MTEKKKFVFRVRERVLEFETHDSKNPERRRGAEEDAT